MEKLYTYEEVCQKLKITKPALKNMVIDFCKPAIQEHKKTRFSEDQVRYIKNILEARYFIKKNKELLGLGK